MSATLTHRSEAPVVADPAPTPAPKRTGWAGFAIVAALAVGFAVTSNGTSDESNLVAESQRMTALAPAIDGSHQVAEDLRFEAIGATVDDSFQFAETQRQWAAASNGVAADNSAQFAETQRQLAAGNVTADDASHEFAEFQRMQALATP